MSFKKQIQSHWDRHPCDYQSTEWDEIDRKRLKEYPFLTSLIDRQQRDNERLLEVGVGIGSDACRILRTTTCHYVAVDISSASCRLAKSHLRLHAPHSQMDVINCDMENLPFVSNCFSRAIAIGSIHHTEHPARALLEISRVAERVTLMVYNRKSWRLNLYYRVSSLLYHKSIRKLILAVDGGTNPQTVLYSPNEITSALKKAGFTHCKLTINYLLKAEYPFRIFRRFVERRWGWCIYVTASKPETRSRPSNRSLLQTHSTHSSSRVAN